MSSLLNLLPSLQHITCAAGPSGSAGWCMGIAKDRHPRAVSGCYATGRERQRADSILGIVSAGMQLTQRDCKAPT